MHMLAISCQGVSFRAVFGVRHIGMEAGRFAPLFQRTLSPILHCLTFALHQTNHYSSFVLRLKHFNHVTSIILIVIFSRSLGGLLTIMFPSSLFAPLIASAVISTVALLVVYVYVVDPDLHANSEDDKESGEGSPDMLDKCVFSNIILGAFIDCVGSLGILRELPLVQYLTFHSLVSDLL